MATIKYKDKEGNYHKVSIGGGSGTDEVYIGSDTPPKGTKVWIDPTAESPAPSVEIEVDMEMSDTSTNPVANKVVKSYVDEAVKNVPSGGGGGNGAKVYKLPIGLMDSAEDNLYQFSSEEMESLVAAVESSDTIFYVAIFDENGLRIGSWPMTCVFEGFMLRFVNSSVFVTEVLSNTDADKYSYTMRVLEFIVVIDTGIGFKREFESVIHEEYK